ncbi:MAG: L-fucose/L-arabinose isomerase family protein [Chloroflexi bacterium]|nr:L-fucose/L-arabinose isomerase family protein [Chloroflexota bacterium]
MNTSLRIGFVPIARPTFDTVLAAQVTAQMAAALIAAGCELVGPATLVMDDPAAQAAADGLAGQPLDLLLLFQASFADSSVAAGLAQAVDAPLLLWALPEERTGGRLRLNSFCGINLAGHALKRAGINYDYVYARPEDAAGLKKLLTLARAGRVKRLLKTARIGRVGVNPTGFEPCGFDGDALARQLGVEIVQRELTGVFAQVRELAPADTAPVLEEIKGKVAGLDVLDQRALRGTLGVYLTLDQLAKEENLQGLAVRCWPEFFVELGCAACGAMSMLTDAGTPCSCEADVNGTVTQLILQGLSGDVAFGTDVVSFDVEQDEAVVWHCGLAPLGMADPAAQPRGTIHSNRKLPLLMEFPLKPGRVTIARLTQSGDGAYRLVIGGGEMLRAPMSFTGTSGVLRFDKPATDVLDTIMHEGLDHHISLTYGDYVDELVALATMLKLPVLRLT